jgi:dienelactone hydrolase
MKYLLVACLFILSLNSLSQTQDALGSKPSGPFGIGFRTTEWVDSSRSDPTGSSQFRTLPVFIWYPAEKIKIEKAYNSLPDSWQTEQIRFFNKKMGESASQFLNQLKTWSVPNAPIAQLPGKWPVLVFGPGLTWTPAEYRTLIEEIVSNGYIVVAYVPAGFAGTTQLANGKIVNGTLDVPQQDILFSDALFVETHLAYLQNSWLKGHMDIDNVGVFGHSIGGAAALVSAAKDSSIKAVADLDGDLMGSALTEKLSQPSLFLCHDERSAIAKAEKKMEKEGRERSEYRRHSDWVRATDDAKISLRLRITDIEHLNFTDLALIPASRMTDSERKNKLGEADGVSSLKLIADLTREFFDYCLKHTSFYTMVGLEQEYPQVQALLWKGLPAH